MVWESRKLTVHQNQRNKNEITHFSNLDHIWWGARTIAGKRRYENKLRAFKKLCKPNSKSNILEIGCGDGEFTKRLSTLKSRVTATDITPAVVNRGKKQVKSKNIRFLVDNAEKMRFKDNTFDIACGISIIHHINPQKVFKEIYRVLKPGGQLFFTEPNLLNPVIIAGLHIGWLRKRMEFSPDETALIRWEAQELLKKTGFGEVKVTNYDFLYPKTPKAMIRLIENVSNVLENIPLVKEVSGSLIVWAKK